MGGGAWKPGIVRFWGDLLGSSCLWLVPVSQAAQAAGREVSRLPGT